MKEKDNNNTISERTRKYIYYHISNSMTIKHRHDNAMSYLSDDSQRSPEF